MKTLDWNTIFKQFSKHKILIVGDSMIDSYMWGNINRQSPEASVPIVNITNYEKRLGGGANVAQNIKNLGAKPILCSVIGNDNQEFFKLMKNQDLETDGILIEDRKTTIKTRVISNEKHQLRIDEEDTKPIKNEDKFIENTIKLMQDVSVIIFQDYNKGVLTKKVIHDLINAAKEKDILIVVDPKKENFLSYKNVDLFKPNLKELNDFLNLSLKSNNLESIEKEISSLQEKLQAKGILLTLSEMGLYYSGNQKVYEKGRKIKAIDVSGAGDSVIAMCALSLSIGLSIDELCSAANLAGSLVCENIGVTPITKEQLLSNITR